MATLASTSQSLGQDWTIAPAPGFDGTISVMTYNVKGGPWPIAWGRPAKLDRIGSTLRALRERGSAPQIVLLQEAFSDEARAIAGRAGYRYVAEGPVKSALSTVAPQITDQTYLSRRLWWEKGGKILNSGLMILSDYPLANIRRMAFPVFACAGLDCYANKGALLVTVMPPAPATPMEVLTTHLNSCHSAHVSEARSLYAFTRQLDLLAAFIRSSRDPGLPLLVGGDFNVGKSPARAEIFLGKKFEWVGSRSANALARITELARQEGKATSDDVAATLQHNTDFQFPVDGRTHRLEPVSVLMPFGADATGQMLSDHYGYQIKFRIESIGSGDPSSSTR